MFKNESQIVAQKQSRTRNSIRNIVWGIAYKLVAIILPFFSRTIIIRWLGMEYAGLGSLFTSIISILSLTELGFNTAILYSMYKTVALGDVKKTNALLNFYKKAYRVVALVILCLGGLFCIRIDLFIAGEVPSSINVYILYALFLLTSVSSYSFFAYAAVLLSANQREDITHKIHIIVTLGREIVQLVLLIVFRNYYIYVSVALLASIIHNLVSFAIVRKKYPQYSASGLLTPGEKKELRRSVGGLMVGKLSVVSRNSFDSVIISSFLGLVATAIYSNYYYIMYSVFGLIYFFCSGLRTSIGNKIAVESVESNYKDLLKFSSWFFIISCICSSLMLCLFQPFMEMWVGAENVATVSLAVLMVVYFFLFCSTGIISQYWEGAGLFWVNKTRYIVESVANLVLDVLLGYWFGLNGIIFATIITMFFFSNIWGSIIVFKYYFKKCSLSRYLLNQLYYLVVVYAICLISFSLCNLISMNGVFGLIIKAFVSISVSAFLLPLLLFWTDEFSLLLEFANNLLKSKSRISLKGMAICFYAFLIVADFSIMVFGYLFVK